jgi:hypothetical protein
MAWHNTTSVSSRTLLSLWLPLPNYCGRQKLSNGWQHANSLGKKSSSDTPILISLHWDIEIHVQIKILNLVVGAMFV